jgi:signal transduction histidine kinase
MQVLQSIHGGAAVQTDQVLYNLSRRGIEWDLLPWLREHHIPLMAYSPIEEGRLLRSRELTSFARRHGRTPAQAALAWLLSKDDLIVIPKTSRRERLQENLGALEHPLSASQLAEGNYDVNFEGGRYSEIAQLADTMNYTSRELAKADNLQKDLIANVSHDLRTPLTMVKSYAEMIRDLSGNNPEKRNAHLQVIIDEADRLNLLVADLLLLSKMQSGVDALNITRFNIKDSIISILNSYRILSEQEGYDFTYRCDADIFVDGDESRIKQVLSNLVNNAVRYSDEDKHISITVTETGSVVRCEVTDKGQGIPEDELEHIWERYYKSSSNHSRNTAGTGLGLSIVKEILLLHKAGFGVISKPNEGSTFWFELPKPL